MKSTRRCSNILLLAMTVLPTMRDSNVAFATDGVLAIEEGMYDLYTDTKSFTYAGNVELLFTCVKKHSSECFFGVDFAIYDCCQYRQCDCVLTNLRGD